MVEDGHTDNDEDPGHLLHDSEPDCRGENYGKDYKLFAVRDHKAPHVGTAVDLDEAAMQLSEVRNALQSTLDCMQFECAVIYSSDQGATVISCGISDDALKLNTDFVQC
jgi:hypothetical protein